mmetsp:Transcript_74183/g.217334  ORF Transcript_74183/g.217334 Transcript_74183/m.217334 type:complete len:205 (+) Transcript_74183:538-1152(+)
MRLLRPCRCGDLGPVSPEPHAEHPRVPDGHVGGRAAAGGRGVGRRADLRGAVGDGGGGAARVADHHRARLPALHVLLRGRQEAGDLGAPHLLAGRRPLASVRRGRGGTRCQDGDRESGPGGRGAHHQRPCEVPFLEGAPDGPEGRQHDDGSGDDARLGEKAAGRAADPEQARHARDQPAPVQEAQLQGRLVGERPVVDLGLHGL